MSRLFQTSDRSDSQTTRRTEPAAETDQRPLTETTLFRLGRVLFGGILALNAIDNLRNLEGRIAYAESKNAPVPNVSVPAISGSLLLGGIGVALWRLPSAAAAAIVGFLVSITPVMHDFWNHDDPEQKQQEVIHFLKNTALLGAALAFLKVGQRRD
ncbi:DoxX family protein [Halobacteria archaeon AArc-m2/3/4]|uniref:DoxX family protein n=1 Tax=Natronoglomus mannanivorans TaxID=2979990 RepID=A0AAP2YZC5_9EURY|nr:DoxX family protein [Halobacteria archaeon AArc-xg1-1]MCU4972025.1 DoxX family protein [Halobacteria archaeon AArc-m2/3/4]